MRKALISCLERPLFHNLNIDQLIVPSVDDAITAIAFVSSGLGLTLGVEFARNLRLPGVTHLPLAVGGTRAFDLSVIYRAGESSQLLDAFLESVHAAAASQTADAKTY